VVVALLERDTDVSRMAAVPGMAVGFVSAGIGRVPASQTYLDITQGNRTSQSLYGGDLPSRIPLDRRGVPPPIWDRILERADGAPADVVPGLLASTLEQAGIPVRADASAGRGALIGADESGRIRRPAATCGASGCPGVLVRAATVDGLPELASRLDRGDLLIAMGRPPPRFRLLALGIMGPGSGGGVLTSSSTRTDGLVTSTDLGPTILARLGVAFPAEMNGREIRAEGTADVGELQSLANRLEVTSGRRGPVVGGSLLAWVVLTALPGLALGRRGARVALALLGLSVVYLPAVLLLTAAIEPSRLGERLIAGIGAPLLAAATLALAAGWWALAVACAVTVVAYAVDVVLGSHLTVLSLAGPNPASGSRFFGIGNELEAMIAALVPLGVGAGLAAMPRTRDGGRQAAAAFLVAGLVAAAVFAIGRFGADVGAAIVLPAGAAVAAVVALGSRRALVLVILAPVAAVAALVLVDVVLGGGAHLTRSVLDAGGLHEAGDAFERRVRLAAMSFHRGANVPYLILVAVVAGLAIWRWRDLRAWFGARSALAGFLGAAAATVIGTASNDSGAVLLIVGALVLAAATAFAWAREG
jgi:hypothetical protein